MKKYFSIAFLLVSVSVFSQSNFKRFFNASSPIKTWVVFHPFKAKKALQISEEAQKVADSIAKTTLLDGDKAGGQVDAFRHIYWMARLHQEIGEKSAIWLGKSYEKSNYITYKKRKLEDGVLPDCISSKMDLFNNKLGASLTVKNSIASKKSIVFKTINTIKAGKAKIIKKDIEGNFLTCEGVKISFEQLKGKWTNNKCLVNSVSKKE